MSFYDFSFAPITFSIMACWIFFTWGKKSWRIKYPIAFIISFSLINCFIYPLVHYEIERQRDAIIEFFLYGVTASAISILANIILYRFHFRRAS